MQMCSQSRKARWNKVYSLLQFVKRLPSLAFSFLHIAFCKLQCMKQLFITLYDKKFSGILKKQKWHFVRSKHECWIWTSVESKPIVLRPRSSKHLKTFDSPTTLSEHADLKAVFRSWKKNAVDPLFLLSFWSFVSELRKRWFVWL